MIQTRSTRTTKEIKNPAGTSRKDRKDKTHTVPAVVPNTVTIQSNELAPAIAPAPNKVEGVILQAPEKPTPPVLHQVVTNDVTTEKLADIMSNNPRGVIRLTDELASFINTMNLYKGGHGADRQFYLSCWSGSTAQVDRKSQDRPIIVREPFVNVFGGIQPDMLGNLEDERGREDGFIHRFLFSFPKPPDRREWDSSTGVSSHIRKVWATVVEWLFGLAFIEPEENEFIQEPQPRTLQFTPEAEAIWVQWHKNHWDETEWDCFPSQLRGVWSKFEVHALTLVLVAHMLKIACEYSLADKVYKQVDPMIDAESMRRGLKLADYFKDHNVRVFNRLKVSKEELRSQRVLAWIRKRPGKSATARELHQNNVAGIKTTSEAKKILKDLEDRGWGEIKTPSGKNPGQGGYFQTT